MYCEVVLEGEENERREGDKLRLPGWIKTAKYICESGSVGKSWRYSAITVKS